MPSRNWNKGASKRSNRASSADASPDRKRNSSAASELSAMSVASITTMRLGLGLFERTRPAASTAKQREQANPKCEIRNSKKEEATAASHATVASSFGFRISHFLR